MWSAGCPLVGDGNTWDFQRLFYSAYYTTYDTYEAFNYMGTLTIDRQQLRQEMYTLYKNPDAVDTILANSRNQQPETYLLSCTETAPEETEIRFTNKETTLMSLPCFRDEDARTLVIENLPRNAKLTVTGTIRNAEENKWYLVCYEGTEGYVYSGHTKPENWMTKFRTLLTGE